MITRTALSAELITPPVSEDSCQVSFAFSAKQKTKMEVEIKITYQVEKGSAQILHSLGQFQTRNHFLAQLDRNPFLHKLVEQTTNLPHCNTLHEDLYRLQFIG